MQKQSLFFTTILSLVLTFSGIAQDIISIVPNSGYTGQTVSVVIRSDQSAFVSGTSVATFGQGITVENFFVNNPFTATAIITIPSNANIGSRDVTVNTGSNQLLMEDGFEIFEGGSNIMSFLEIVPVQLLYVSDFDPNNAKNSPLLFTITLVNDNQVRDLRMVFTISGERYGLLGTATKELISVSANNVSKTTNRDFDEYSISGMGEELLGIVKSTGIAPPDVYTYHIEIFDLSGTLLSEDEGINIITNPNSDIELITPGVSFDESPEVIQQPQPFFQWFSNASKFDFTLYEVTSGQTSPQDIIEGYPVYEQKELGTQSLAYPLSAEPLQEGKTYAWQVKAHVYGSGGDYTVPSRLYWFTYKSTDPFIANIDRIEITPIISETGISTTVEFKALVYGDNDELLDIQPTWKVVPENIGIIDQNGRFNAGNYPKTGAIVATVNQVSEYSTITIRWDQGSIGGWEILNDLFGLPASNKK